jgi:hypothetical protein
MIDVEPQPRIDTLVRSGQTGAIVDAAATFTDDWADLDPGARQRPPWACRPASATASSR